MDKFDAIDGSFKCGHRLDGKDILKKQLTNILNYIHFQDGVILAIFRHIRFDTVITVQAQPLPCIDDIVSCVWVSPGNVQRDRRSYYFVELLVTDGLKFISIPAEPQNISNEGASFILPEKGVEISSRNVKRHPCTGITVELLQSSGLFRGTLIDFSAESFCVEVSPAPPQSFLWINDKDKIYTVLKKDKDILYSGDCMIVRQTAETLQRRLILRPLASNHPRFRSKTSRSPRYLPQPAPSIYFTHPLTGKMITLCVDGISGSGFSVKEYYESSVLMVGLVIPELKIVLANNLTLRCRVQVVHRSLISDNEEKASVKTGIAFLDIDMQDQVCLSSLLQQMQDKRAFTCNKVDLDSLWQFFFEVGFIYPEKYASMHEHKESFKQTYKKLYIDGPSIARHFTYQDRGEILGHIAMLRAYENTWLFHHHAAKSNGLKAGLAVLNQISQYVNNFYLLNSSHMHYVISYYRPENRFPHRIFGGFKELLNNPRCCSIDPFAFFHMLKPGFPIKTVGELATAQASDIIEFQRFYEHKYCGLMVHALDITPDTLEAEGLNDQYREVGFKRERHLFSIRVDGCLQALIAVTVTDTGLNMSNVTNCIKVFVMLESLDVKLVYSALSELTHFYVENDVPVMIFPANYAMQKSIPFEKIYNLWAITTAEGTEPFIKYMESILGQRIHSGE